MDAKWRRARLGRDRCFICPQRGCQTVLLPNSQTSQRSKHDWTSGNWAWDREL